MINLPIELDVIDFALHFGAHSEYYNARVFTQNGIEDTPDRRERILRIHIARHYVFSEFRKSTPEDKMQLAVLRDQLHFIELMLQQEWGFPQDPDFHSYWYQVPYCKCPVMDNRDMFGMKIINSDCPVHGSDSVKETGVQEVELSQVFGLQ